MGRVSLLIRHPCSFLVYLHSKKGADGVIEMFHRVVSKAHGEQKPYRIHRQLPDIIKRQILAAVIRNLCPAIRAWAPSYSRDVYWFGIWGLVCSIPHNRGEGLPGGCVQR